MQQLWIFEAKRWGLKDSCWEDCQPVIYAQQIQSAFQVSPKYNIGAPKIFFASILGGVKVLCGT